MVWFGQGIPRCSFITWLAVRNHLSTGVRMRSWGAIQPCVLCGEPDESRDHLFFACLFSFNVWSALTGPLLHHREDPDWEVTLTQVVRGTRNHLHDNDILLRLCFQTTVYLIWKERNIRIHQSGFSSILQITKRAEKLIRNRITSLDYMTRPKLRVLLQHWFAVTAQATST